VLFDLAPGRAYALSGDARNFCLHGVLADDGREGEARDAKTSTCVSACTTGQMPCGEADSEEEDARVSTWKEIERHSQQRAEDDNTSVTEP